MALFACIHLGLYYVQVKLIVCTYHASLCVMRGSPYHCAEEDENALTIQIIILLCIVVFVILFGLAV